MAENYWNLGNAITGFTVLQAIAFLYALSEREKRIAIGRAKNILVVPGAIAATFYIVAIWHCYDAATAFYSNHIFVGNYFWTAVGQTAIVFLNTFGILFFGYLILLKAERDQQLRSEQIGGSDKI